MPNVGITVCCLRRRAETAAKTVKNDRNLAKLGQDESQQIEEAEQTPDRIKSKKSMPKIM